jgi:hypothetical protein
MALIGHTLTPRSARPWLGQGLSSGYRVAVAVGDPPLAGFAAVYLGGPQRAGARLAVYRDRGVLQAGRVGHVARHVAGLQVEGVGRAVGEAAGQSGEQLAGLPLAKGAAQRAQDAHGLVTGPERPAGGGVAVVQRQLRLVQRCPDPGQELVAIGHAPEHARDPAAPIQANTESGPTRIRSCRDEGCWISGRTDGRGDRFSSCHRTGLSERA